MRNFRGRLASLGVAMSKAMTVTLVTLLAAVLGGCITYPQPHEVVEVSPVHGVLQLGGEPLPGKRLSMNSAWNAEPCADAVAEVITDEQGRFRFDERTRRRLFRTVILAPSSPTYSLTVCLQQEGGAVPLFHTQVWAALPRELELQCELSVENTERDYCRVVDWKGFNFTDRQSLRPEYGRERIADRP